MGHKECRRLFEDATQNSSSDILELQVRGILADSPIDSRLLHGVYEEMEPLFANSVLHSLAIAARKAKTG